MTAAVLVASVAVGLAVAVLVGFYAGWMARGDYAMWGPQ